MIYMEIVTSFDETDDFYVFYFMFFGTQTACVFKYIQLNWLIDKEYIYFIRFR